MKRIVTLIGLIAALGAVSVPAAKADGAINIPIGGTSTSTSTSSGSAQICLDAAVCPHWSTYQGYAFWGPVSFFGTRSGANDYLVYVYWVYDSTGRTYYGNAGCYWLGTTIFRGCFWL
jgi:hypothetical protein